MALSIMASSVGVPDVAAQGETKKYTSLEEVLVTARRRTESMQETPIAVSAISGDDIIERGMVNTRELTQSVPSLQIGNAGAVQIYIRGIGERTGFTRVDPSVGVYLDGIYIPRVDGQLFDTVDIESIQVLRGPQGSLFGKNTTGGAMLLTLKKPSSEREGYVSAGLGSNKLFHGKVGWNFPISDSLSARVAVSAITDDGYMKDDIADEQYSSNNRQSLLAQLRWIASDDVSVDSFMYLSHTDEQRPGRNCSITDENALFMRGLYLAFPGDTDPSNPRAWRDNCLANSTDNVGDMEVNLGENPNHDYEYTSGMLGTTVDWELADLQVIKFIVGARGAVEGAHQISDSDAGPANFLEAFSPEDSDRASISAEIQYSGVAFDDRFQFTTGLFGLREQITDVFLTHTSLIGFDLSVLGQLGAGSPPLAPPPPGGTIPPIVGVFSGPLSESDFELNNTTLGAFFQGSFDITEHLQLTLGVRRTRETRETDLVFTPSDIAAIDAILESHPQIAPAIAPGLHPFLGTWSMDPVGIAASLFTDSNGDGIPEYPQDRANAIVQDESVTFQETSPMASLSYVLPEDWLSDTVFNTSMLYLTWSNGFKSGFFEPRGADGLIFIEPERVQNIEGGFKIDAFDRRMRFNGAVYHMNYENIQLLQVSTDKDNNTAVTMNNAGEAEISGIELELTFLPVPNLLVNFTYSYNDYEYIEFDDNDLVGKAVMGVDIPIDRTDETFALVPEHTAYLGVQYEWHTGIGTFIPRVDVNYKSEIYHGLDPGAWLAYEQDKDRAGVPSYTVANARLSWRASQGDLLVSAYVRNLTDERYALGGAAVGDSIGNYNVTPGEPRVYGLEFRKEFY